MGGAAEGSCLPAVPLPEDAGIPCAPTGPLQGGSPSPATLPSALIPHLHHPQPCLHPLSFISITPSPAFIPTAANAAPATGSRIPARRGRWRGARGTGALKIKRKMIKGGMWVSAGNPVTLETGSKYLG